MNKLVDERPIEVASVDWNDELRIEVTLLDGRQDLSIEQAEQLADWLVGAAESAREALRGQLAGLRSRMAVPGPQSGGEAVL